MSNELQKVGDNDSQLPKRHKAFNLEIDILNRRDDAYKFFNDLLKGRKQGVTSPAEAMLVYGRCMELNLPFMYTIDHMSVIQGKVCADIHINTALALRAGASLWWEKTKDFEPLYQYTDSVNTWISPYKPNEFIEKLSKEDPVVATLQYVWDVASKEACTKAGKTPFWNSTGKHGMAIDYVTEYTFYRARTVNGEYRPLVVKGKFSVAERHAAKLGYNKSNQPDPDSNWGKYERRMTDVRAWTNGFKEIASDLGMGMPEISEMADVAGIAYSFDPVTGNASVKLDYNPAYPKNEGRTTIEEGSAEVIDENDNPGDNDAGDTHDDDAQTVND